MRRGSGAPARRRCVSREPVRCDEAIDVCRALLQHAENMNATALDAAFARRLLGAAAFAVEHRRKLDVGRLHLNRMRDAAGHSDQQKHRHQDGSEPSHGAKL